MLPYQAAKQCALFTEERREHINLFELKARMAVLIFQMDNQAALATK